MPRIFAKMKQFPAIQERGPNDTVANIEFVIWQIQAEAGSD